MRNLDADFELLIARLPRLLDALNRCSPHIGMPLKGVRLPARAVYLFSREGEALYVGRTNRLKARIKEHISGKNNDAPFAFKIARYETGYFKGRGSPTRSQLEKISEFAKAFEMAKVEVSQMQWRWVEIEEANLQCLFEIYATIALKAKFNDFENH